MKNILQEREISCTNYFTILFNLKGQCHKMYYLQFLFIQRYLKYFWYWFWICWYISFNYTGNAGLSAVYTERYQPNIMIWDIFVTELKQDNMRWKGIFKVIRIIYLVLKKWQYQVPYQDEHWFHIFSRTRNFTNKLTYNYYS